MRASSTLRASTGSTGISASWLVCQLWEIARAERGAASRQYLLEDGESFIDLRVVDVVAERHLENVRFQYMDREPVPGDAMRELERGDAGRRRRHADQVGLNCLQIDREPVDLRQALRQSPGSPMIVRQPSVHRP